MHSPGLKFGIYPLGVAGTPAGLAVGPEDDYEQIQLALKRLRGKAKSLLPRMYLVYTGPADTDEKLLSIVDKYVRSGLIGDLTVGSLAPDIEMERWLGLIRKIIRQYGSEIASLQITNEPNLTFMDGANPNIVQMLVQGVIAAKEETQKANVGVKIGFGSVPDNGPKTAADFWEKLARIGGETFTDSLDYVAHNFYVDVFEEPLSADEIPGSVERLLRRLREVNLRTAGIPDTIPIHIAENGWPTGKNPFTGHDRTYERQAEVLELIIRTVYQLRHELNITHYKLFGLRDADSSKDDLFHQFGIMRDDYTPKPAFHTFQRLVQELGE
ncbi:MULTISPECIES: hypothetical protein [unclassified Thermoactinomyces]|jgi:hypothetical protein|uniref:hypothetical protein n=1 Tax=unclassified Thermoactinomyces TaxID=2634588 RepID=UPI0018DDD9AF|nr:MULTISPECIES: hypothetical protein [unclassified Thermoactinomyces]MBH8599374.1 hypothetical protein [Thermoactinomyces sp. CICC 10523]MBH8605156.1 hypothetical protein [Thermoactinomyces sp. CICC 10522]